MIVVMMGDEDCADIAKVDARARQASRHSITGIDDIIGSVDGEKIRRLCPARSSRNATFAVLPPAVPREEREQFDFVIFDGSPLRDYSESCFLAEKMDGVILVVEAERTKAEVLRKIRKDGHRDGFDAPDGSGVISPAMSRQVSAAHPAGAS